MTKAAETPVWLNGTEAADWFGVSWPTMRQMILDHDIPHIRIGSRWKINTATLDEHLHRLAETRGAA